MKPLPLAKLFSTTGAPPGGAGVAPSPNFFVHTSPLSHPQHVSDGMPGKPTGTYPKHWLKKGEPGYNAIHNAQRGIAPPTPNTQNAGPPPPGMIR